MGLKVCMISGSYPPMKDGVGDYTQRLFSVLKRKFEEPNIFLITTKNSKLEETEPRVFGLIEKWGFRALPNIIRFIKRIRADIVHIQYPTYGYGRNPAINFLPTLLRVAWPKIKIVSTIHEFSNRTLKGKLRLLASIIPSHIIIIVNQQYEGDIQKFWPFIKGKLVHIPVGTNILPPLELDESEICRLRSSLGIGENDTVISYFGVVRAGKGLELLLKAFHELLQKRPKAQLLLIGSIDEEYYKQFIQRIIEDKHLNSSVIFTDSCGQEKISQYFALADICVLPFEDGVSTKRTSFMAALQHKLPIITTRSEFLPDGLVDYKNVILIKYGNEEALVSKMIELIEDEKLRNKLHSNTEKLLKDYSWDSITEKTISVYHSLGKVRGMRDE